MTLNKLKLKVLALLFLGFIASGAGLLGRSLAITKADPAPSAAGARSVQESKVYGATPSAHPNRIVIAGRVLGTDAKPIPGARVAIVVRAQPQARDPRELDRNEVLGSARADAEGRFRVDFSRITPDLGSVALIVRATGWALGVKVLESGLASQDESISLGPERIYRGRLVDLRGQPIRGARVRVSSYQTPPFDTAGLAPPWPSSVTTDEQGRFTLRELSHGALIRFEASSDHHARQTFLIDPRDEARTGEQAFALSPAQVIEIRVTRTDDRKPAPGTWVKVLSLSQRIRAQGTQETDAWTDEQGLARINPWIGDSFWVTASPHAGEPYLNTRVNINWPKGAVRQVVELKLKRGVPVRGTISEEASGMPVAGALVVYFQTSRNNSLFRGFEGEPSEVITDREGRFQTVAPPGPGHFLLRAATPDYLHLSTNNLELGIGGLPIWSMYPDALVHVDLKPDETVHEATMLLRRGVTVAGKIVGPDGAPVATAIAFGRSYVPNLGIRAFVGGAFNGIATEIKVRDGRFQIPGCDPAKPYTFHFFDREHQLGATVELGGKSAENGPAVVQLQKCGAARVRYIDPQGKPIPSHQPDHLTLIITPGTDSPARDKTMADRVFQVNLDPKRMRGSRTGADGRITIVSLIPGATYRFRGHEFTAEADKTVDLPDVTLSNP
jgi:hypothetical protein